MNNDAVGPGLESVRKRLNLLADVSRVMMGGESLAQMARDLTVRICEAMDVDACIIRVLDGDDLILLAERGVPQARDSVRMSVLHGIAAEIFATRRPLVIARADEHPATAHLHKEAADGPPVTPLPFTSPSGKFVFLSYAGAPMLIGNRILGILGVYQKTAYRDFDNGDADHLQIVANHLAVAMTGHRLYEGMDEERQRLREDVSRRERAETLAVHNALHDQLTGLPNRALMSEHITQGLALARRRMNYGFGVLVLGFDRFRLVNESLGHRTGDEFLLNAARVMERELRPGDLLARFGGDEFAVLLEDISRDSDARAAADRILQAVQRPVCVGGHDMFASASIGLVENAACYEQAADCLRDAETAMHHAKAAGRGRQSSFSPEMNARAKRLFSLGSDLHRAAARGELELDYQPVFGLPENRTVGFEALIRWRHPLRGRLMPSEFIAIAEDSGLISAIGEWALLEACRQAAAWRMAWIPPHDGSDAPAPWVAVNLSARQLADPGLADAVEAALAGAALAADGLRLEVTESVLMTRPEMAIETLSGLQQKGIAISLDDFGTGYSSIQTLDRLPVSTLKIDRGFVWRMDHPRGARMVTAIIQFAHVMDLEVVAEGVETAAQFRALADLGCSRVQGYYVAQPMSGEESLAWTGRPSPKWLAPEPVGL